MTRSLITDDIVEKASDAAMKADLVCLPHEKQIEAALRAALPDILEAAAKRLDGLREDRWAAIELRLLAQEAGQ